MTIVTRQSSPRTGIVPGDCTNTNTNTNTDNNSNSNNDDGKSSRKKMKIIKRKLESEGDQKPIPNRLMNLVDGLKSVMCETTNLTPAKSAAVSDPVTLLNSSAPSPPGSDILDLDATGGVEVEGVKKGVKKISKAKLKTGSGPPKEDLVACRKSKRLLNKHSRYDRARFGYLSDAKNALGRTVELINPLEERLDRDCVLTKVLFLGSLDLKPNYCSTTAKNPVGSLKGLCMRELIKQRKSQLESNELYYPAEKRLRRDSNEDDLEQISHLERVTDPTWKLIVNITKLPPDGNGTQDAQDDISNKSGDDEQGEYLNFDDHITSVLKGVPDGVSGDKLKSLTDCIRMILEVGTKCTITGKGPPVQKEVEDLINQWNARPEVNNDSNDKEVWLSWEDHVLSLIRSSTNTNDKAQGHRNSMGHPNMSKDSVSMSTDQGLNLCNSGSSPASGCSSSSHKIT